MNVAVFCASSTPSDRVYSRVARELGEKIALRSWGLVYGGTDCGLMQEVAEAVLQKGGKAKGIIPECIVDLGIAAKNLTELIVVPDMKERKQLLRDTSDAFIALPGGWGTLEEITEVLTLKQFGQHQKPIVFLNTSGYYDAFFKFISDAQKKGFISFYYENLYGVVDTPIQAIQYIENYRPPLLAEKYKKRE